MVRTRVLLYIIAAVAPIALVLFAEHDALGKGLSPEDQLSATSIQAALDTAYAQFKDLKEGANADYIPALAKVDPNLYGIALITVDGKVYTKGDVTSEVSI